uniref:Uncharacterized protein n=1 Tax=Glossina austeni TaxID=7395 RepID=A0A1A9URN4_GLOAU
MFVSKTRFCIKNGSISKTKPNRDIGNVVRVCDVPKDTSGLYDYLEINYGILKNLIKIERLTHIIDSLTRIDATSISNEGFKATNDGADAVITLRDLKVNRNTLTHRYKRAHE